MGINHRSHQGRCSMQRMADVMVKEKAQRSIDHDEAQRATQKTSPEFYE